MDVPLMFRPWRKSLGWDYEKVFVDHPGYQVDQYIPVYERLGISKTKGCLIVLRPDQHVSCWSTRGLTLTCSNAQSIINSDLCCTNDLHSSRPPCIM